MGDISARGQARTHADGDKATMYKKKPRSLTLVLDSFVPSARVMDREKISGQSHPRYVPLKAELPLLSGDFEIGIENMKTY